MSKQIDKQAHFAAVEICNLFATTYMDVHNQAGPWGTKHLDDVTLIIQTAISVATKHCEKQNAAMSALLDRMPHVSNLDCPRCSWERMKKEKE